MKPFTTLAAILFSIIGIVHLVRYLGKWPVMVNGMEIPVGISLPVFAVFVLIAFFLWKEAKK